MMKLNWSVPAAALLLAACVAADRNDIGPAPAQAMAPADIVAARQAAFHMSAVTSGSLKNAVTSGADLKSQAFAARGLARWANALPTMFPPSTASVPSRARPEIWTSRAEFDRIAAEFASHAGALPQLAQAGGRAQFAARLEAAQATCSACHDRFRADP
ncbi:MAG TPA: cytochrome c [Allosphingosinicella sp.]|nr:cytochrome c [Allosphingosinicella sp.]